MSIGLMALLDDVAGLAKVAAASLDDVAAQATQAGIKAAGVVIDDAAVTPRYVVGFAAARELPIVGKIALGSLRNKLVFLLPIALVLSLFAPWAIKPLLMIGGAYLSYEGTEKIYEAIAPRAFNAHEPAAAATSRGPQALEAEKVSSAIKTDFILSAEIMAITLGSLPEGSLWSRALVLAIVGTGITVAVYGGVALIVKADDIGVALARLGGRSAARAAIRLVGRGLVRGMPILLGTLGVVGTAAMVWVGGGILLHGLDVYGAPWLVDGVEATADVIAAPLGPLAAMAHWAVTATLSGLAGLAVGAALLPLVALVLAPALASLRALRG